MPKVSVIIPIYGVEKYIERCAISLFEQTLDDIEYIFIDDCTKDNSIEILCKVLGRYPNRKKQTRIEKMLTNSGLPAVRQHGIQLATGDYIIHCDSDDWVDIHAYEKMYNRAIEGNYDIVYCDYFRCVDSRFKVVRQANIKNNKEYIQKILCLDMAACVWNKLINRNFYLKNDINNRKDIIMGEDLLTMLPLLYKTTRIAKVDIPLYYYVYNPNSIVNNIKEKNIENVKDIVEIFENFFSQDKILLKSLSIYKYKQKALFLFFSDNNIRKKYFNLWNDVNLNIKEVGFKYWIMTKSNTNEIFRIICLILLYIYRIYKYR